MTVNKPRKSQRGQSLLEMIFAIGILLMAIVAILALTISGATGEKESETQIVANNLAREGIEAVRNIRDGNWLAGRSWDEGLTLPAKTEATANFSAAANKWSLDFNFISDALYLSSSPAGIYSHQAGGALAGYFRRLTLQSICQDSDGQETIINFCAAGDKKIGLKIKSTVKWTDKNKTQQVILEDLLYEWK